MKKTFQLSHPKIKTPRLVEAAKSDVRKYLKRERKRTLPEDADYWDFDCKFGPSEEEAKPIHLGEMTQCMDDAEVRQLDAFYVEVHAKPGYRKKKPPASENEAPDPAD